MSTVKITDLPAINTINANTANTVLVGVDIPTNITGKISLTTLAAGLYSNNNLVVGNNFTVLPNVVGQFTGNSTTYIQVNLENQTSSGSGDFVVTADDGNDTNHFIDMGINGSTYSDPTYSSTQAHDGYLYVSSSGSNKGNLSIGTTNSTGKVNFVVGGLETANIVGYIDVNGIWSNSINSVVTANAASANTVINTRISANVATLRGEITGNVATLRGEITGNVATLRGEITSNISTANVFTQAAFNKANSAIANVNNVITAGDFYISGDGYVDGVVHPAKGFIYTPRILTGAQTAITIDFATDSMIRATFSSTLTMSLSNYIEGKVVEVWLTNTAGNGQTINLGILANNSTTGSTTLSVASGRSAKLKYFSIDADLANTFCAITYA